MNVTRVETVDDYIAQRDTWQPFQQIVFSIRRENEIMFIRVTLAALDFGWEE